MATLPARPQQQQLERLPLAFADYGSLPETARSEYVDGHVIVSPPPSARHQRVVRRLANTIEDAAPDLFVVCSCGVWTGPERSRFPDVLATPTPFDAPWAPQVPVLVAEVVAANTRVEDTLRKSGEYYEAGVGQYWVVDPETARLTALVHTGRSWDVALELDTDTLAGAVAIGEYGVAEVDLWTLLAP